MNGRRNQRLAGTVTAQCACGQVAMEAVGAPITSVICHCDDCQEGARQIHALPHAGSIDEPDGGTAYLAYRKDRITCLKGASLLRHHKIRANTTTNRVIATCCNSAMYLGFDDGKHWIDLYRARCTGDVLPVQMRICTKFRSGGRTHAADVPEHSGYPLSFLFKLLLAKAAMVLQKEPRD